MGPVCRFLSQPDNMMIATNKERGERIMRRVGARFRMQEVVEATDVWKEKWMCASFDEVHEDARC